MALPFHAANFLCFAFLVAAQHHGADLGFKRAPLESVSLFLLLVVLLPAGLSSVLEASAAARRPRPPAPTPAPALMPLCLRAGSRAPVVPGV